MEPGSPTSTTPLLLPSYGSASHHDSQNNPHSTRVRRAPTFMLASVPNRRSIVRAFIDITLTMMFELVLPIALYYAFRAFFSPLVALVLAGVPPAFMVVFKGIREHKVDMTGLLMLLGFAFSVLLALVESDPKLYLLRESTMTSAMGIMLLITLFPFRYKTHTLRPFMFYVARQIAVTGTIILDTATVRLHWDWFWRNWSTFRAFFRGLTFTWAAGLLSEFVVRVFLLYTLDDVDEIVYYSNIYMFAVTLTLGVVTLTSTLLLRHLFNREQARSREDERRQEIEEIIARADQESRIQRGQVLE